MKTNSTKSFTVTFEYKADDGYHSVIDKVFNSEEEYQAYLAKLAKAEMSDEVKVIYDSREH